MQENGIQSKSRRFAATEAFYKIATLLPRTRLSLILVCGVSHRAPPFAHHFGTL